MANPCRWKRECIKALIEIVLPFPAGSSQRGLAIYQAAALTRLDFEQLTGSMKNDSSLPWDSEVFVDLSTVEELVHQFCKSLLHAFVEDDILPTGLLDLIIQGLALCPISIVDVDVLIIVWEGPFPNVSDKIVGNAVRGKHCLSLPRLFQYVLISVKAHCKGVQYEIFIAPSEIVFGKCSSFTQPIWHSTTLITRDVAAEASDALILDIKFSGGMAIGGKGEKWHL